MGGKYYGQTVDYYERGRGWDQDYGGGRVLHGRELRFQWVDTGTSKKKEKEKTLETNARRRKDKRLRKQLPLTLVTGSINKKQDLKSSQSMNRMHAIPLHSSEMVMMMMMALSLLGISLNSNLSVARCRVTLGGVARRARERQACTSRYGRYTTCDLSVITNWSMEGGTLPCLAWLGRSMMCLHVCRWRPTPSSCKVGKFPRSGYPLALMG